MDKATKYALQLRVIAQESYPNVDRHSFLVEKLRLLIQQLKQSIHHLKQLDDAMIQLAQQLDYFENIHSIPGIGKLSTAMIIGEIGDIKRFKSNKQLNAFVALISNDINQVIHTVEIPSTSVVIKSEKTFILGDYEYNKRAASL